jgi:soluble lytic murein transglycosylase
MPFAIAPLAAAILLAVVSVPVSANETDAIVTGSLGEPVNVMAQQQDLPGTADFVAALDDLLAGRAAAAFTAASELPDRSERLAVQWAAIHYHPTSIAPDAIESFFAEAGSFLDPHHLNRSLERSLLAGEPASSDYLRHFETVEPSMLDNRIALALALRGSDMERATALARDIWTGTILSTEQEAELGGAFEAALTAEEHWQRATMLMMHDHIRAAERLESHFDDAQIGLIAARAATARGEPDGKDLLDTVDARLHEHPVYLFTRVQRAHAAGLLEEAVRWLEQSPADVPEAGEWWIVRDEISRAALADGDVHLAYRAIAGFEVGPAGRLVDAQFTAGWLALNFLDDADAAQRHFALMAQHATLPDSITKANFWLARAEIARDAFDAADAAYAVAAEYGTVYYGQLARSALGLDQVPAPAELPDLTEASEAFAARDTVRAIRLLARHDARGMAAQLLRNWTQDLETASDLVLAALLAQDIGAHNVAIAVADRAAGLGWTYDTLRFPSTVLPAGTRLAANPAAVFAVIKQESLFQLDAVSHAGARGLMQLMPGTARETATRLGLDYVRDRLTRDPQYNVLLGSTYLSDQLERYDGSLLLAAAAYNAGPGNANRWIRAFGDPRAANVDPILWVELIPFEETKTYVRRVMGNYLVYRRHLDQDATDIASVMRGLP